MSSNVLIAEREVPLEMENIEIGKIKVQVYEGPPVHVQTEGVNTKFLIARTKFHGKEYEIMSNRGGIEGAIADLKKKILDDLKK